MAARGALLHRFLAPRGAPQRAAPAGAAVPLAAAAGSGAHAQGRQATPLRMALEQIPGWRRVDRWRAGEGRWQALRRQGQGACVALKW